MNKNSSNSESVENDENCNNNFVKPTEFEKIEEITEKEMALYWPAFHEQIQSTLIKIQEGKVSTITDEELVKRKEAFLKMTPEIESTADVDK